MLAHQHSRVSEAAQSTCVENTHIQQSHPLQLGPIINAPSARSGAISMTGAAPPSRTAQSVQSLIQKHNTSPWHCALIHCVTPPALMYQCALTVQVLTGPTLGSAHSSSTRLTAHGFEITNQATFGHSPRPCQP